jgi:hypothetical protein
MSVDGGIKRMMICKKTKERIIEDIEYKLCNGYCCKKMKKRLNQNDNHMDTLRTEKDKFYIRFHVRRNGSYSDYYSTEDEELKHCPFCGERIGE